MKRSVARARAMQLVYEWELGGDGGEDTRLGLLEIKEGPIVDLPCDFTAILVIYGNRLPAHPVVYRTGVLPDQHQHTPR